MNRYGQQPTPAPCPHCGVSVPVARLRAGDVLVCLACAGAVVCDRVTKLGRAVLRRPTLAERQRFNAEGRVSLVQAAVIRDARVFGRELAVTRAQAAPASQRTVH